MNVCPTNMETVTSSPLKLLFTTGSLTTSLALGKEISSPVDLQGGAERCQVAESSGSVCEVGVA